MTFPHSGQARVFIAKVGIEVFEAIGNANIIVYMSHNMICRQISAISAI